MSRFGIAFPCTIADRRFTDLPRTWQRFSVPVGEGYFPTPPMDTLQDIRSECVLKMMACGIDEFHLYFDA